jgi:cell division protein FtsB
MIDKETFVLALFLVFSIGFMIGWLASKIQDVDKELENEKLRKDIIELELKLNKFKSEQDFLRKQIELLQDECDAYQESFVSGINTRNF